MGDNRGGIIYRHELPKFSNWNYIWIIGFSTLDSFKEVYFYAIVVINNLHLSSN